MDASPKGRSAERPPSPAAPRGRRSPRLWVTAGASVLAIATAAAFVPAAADDGARDESPKASRQAAVAEAAPAARPALERDPDPHARATHARTVRFLIAASKPPPPPPPPPPAPEPAPAPAPEPAPAPAPEPAVSNGGVWDSLARCESGGNWAINTGNGYYGGLQFNLQTWQAYGGSGMPHQNSRGAQIAVAERVQAAQGWGAWPSCSSQLGLR